MFRASSTCPSASAPAEEALEPPSPQADSAQAEPAAARPPRTLRRPRRVLSRRAVSRDASREAVGGGLRVTGAPGVAGWTASGGEQSQGETGSGGEDVHLLGREREPDLAADVRRGRGVRAAGRAGDQLQ